MSRRFESAHWRCGSVRSAAVCAIAVSLGAAGGGAALAGEPCDDSVPPIELVLDAAACGGRVVVTARGLNPSSGWTTTLVESPLTIYPPQFGLYNCPPDGVVLPVIVPVLARADFSAPTPASRVTVFVLDASQPSGAIRVEVPIRPMPTDRDGDADTDSGDLTLYVSAWFADVTTGSDSARFGTQPPSPVGSPDLTNYVNAWLAALTAGCP